MTTSKKEAPGDEGVWTDDKEEYVWLFEKQFRDRTRKRPQVMCLFGYKRSKTMWLNEKQFRERTSKRPRLMCLDDKPERGPR